MNLLKLLWQAFLYLPQAVVQAFQQRRRHLALDQLEVERLDRIRNPSKYRGKDC